MSVPIGTTVWLNGALVPPEHAALSVFDHGITVGDGVFETVRVTDGEPFALSRHLDRLVASARGLLLPDPDLARLRGAIEEVLAAGNQHGLRSLRITYTGGVGPLGSSRGDAPPTLLIATSPAPDRGPSSSIVTVPWTRNEQGATAGLKTTSYAGNVVALAYCHARGGDEAVFANTAGNLCEGTGSNVVVAVDGQLVTPPLSAGCLAGVTRALVLEWCDVVEADIAMAAFHAADEVFLTSTTRDIHPVHEIDGRHLSAPGPLTAAAMAAFAARAAASIDP